MKKIFLLFALLMPFCTICKTATASEVSTLDVYHTHSDMTETPSQNIADEFGGKLLQVVDRGNYPRTESQQTNKMRVVVGDRIFPATLADNNTAEDFKEMLPLTITMTELNGNEKYYYFNDILTTDASVPDMIHAGDIMLYGRNCLVLFYKTFSTTYSYTRIGCINDPTGLAEALGTGSATVTYELVPDITGDLNADGEVDVSDVTLMISAILGERIVNLADGDLNDDKVIDVADVTDLIALILNKR